jgi:hypothetical protein
MMLLLHGYSCCFSRCFAVFLALMMTTIIQMQSLSMLNLLLRFSSALSSVLVALVTLRVLLSCNPMVDCLHNNIVSCLAVALDTVVVVVIIIVLLYYVLKRLLLHRYLLYLYPRR